MAQYQPFVLQVQRMKPQFSTGPNYVQNPGEEETTPFVRQEYRTEQHNKSEYQPWSWFRISTGAFCLFALALFFALLAVPLGHIDKMSNAKSMHFTRNTRAFTFWSLLPSQAYAENMEVQKYRVVDSVLDKKDVNDSEEHGFLIAGGFGILTNVSSNVYVSALLIVYVISLLEAAVYRENEVKHGQKRNVYFAWASVGLVIAFVMLQLIVKFNTYHQVEWGKSKIEVTYMWESGASIVYATLVVLLFVTHVNVKNHAWHAIFPSMMANNADHEAGVDKTSGSNPSVVTGTRNNGPYYNEAHFMFSVTFFLFVMALLGDSRQLVLETEAQLLVLCAISLAVITVLSERVREYYLHVEAHYLKDGNHTSYREMVSHTLQLVQVIALTVSLALFGMTIHILRTMYDSSDWNLLCIFVVVVTGLYILLRLLHVVNDIAMVFWPGNHMTETWAMVYKYYYFLSILAVTIVICVLLASGDSKLDSLKRLESAQPLSMDKSVLKKNDACKNSGIQSNGLLFTELELKTDSSFKIEDTDKNPVSFKVNAWTNWWSMKKDATRLYADLYLCSTGVEQQFGSCRTQYRSHNGLAYDSAVQKSLTDAAVDFATTPAT